MALSYNLAYQEIISVHPTRRQIFAGKPYSTFPNIWEWLIFVLTIYTNWSHLSKFADQASKYLVNTQEVRIQRCSSPLSDSNFANCGEFNNLYKLWTACTTFFNLRKLFTAFSSCCDIIKQLVSFIAIKSTKQVSEWVSQSVSEWQA